MTAEESSRLQRLQREVAHGATTTAVHQAEFGWDSPAGIIRRQRRIDFICNDIPRDAKVLEVGAGTGLQTAGLLQHFSNIVGIDISPELLEVARKRAPGAEYLVMDAHAPSYPKESFDAIVGVSILHHLDWDLALQNYYPLLRPGGFLRFSEPNLLNPQIFLQKNIPFIKRMVGDSPDEYAFTPGQIRRSLAQAGFTQIDVQPYEFLHPGTPERWIPAVIRLESFLMRTPLRSIGGSLLIGARRA